MIDNIVWVVMITNAGNAPWRDDIVIYDLRGTGLRVPSVVRPIKLSAYEAADVQPIGRVNAVTLGRALDYLAHGRRA